MAPRYIKTKVSSPALGLSLPTLVSWAFAILGLIALALAGFALHASSWLQILYALAATVVGTLLYWSYPTIYLGFTWWLWFLTPEVRRLVDYHQGYNPESPVMLAPLLVAALSFFTLLPYL